MDMEKDAEYATGRNVAEIRDSPLWFARDARWLRNRYLRSPKLAEKNRQELEKECAEYRAYAQWQATQVVQTEDLQLLNLAIHYLRHGQNLCKCRV